MSPFWQGCSGRLKGAFEVLFGENLVVWQQDPAFRGGDGGRVTIVSLFSIGGMRQLIQGQCCSMHNWHLSLRGSNMFPGESCNTAELEEISRKTRSRSRLVLLVRDDLDSMERSLIVV